MIKYSKLYPIIILMGILSGLIYFYFKFTSNDQELPEKLKFLEIIFRVMVVAVLGIGIYLWRKKEH